MVYTRPTHSDSFTDGSATDGTIIIDALSDGLEAAEASLLLKAPLASPTFTGTPAAPTASAGTNTTQLATTAFVTGAIAVARYTGTGSPEAAVTAPVGSTYIDTAATRGAIKWIKATGAGNTGWVVEFGDTGWRSITSSNATWDTASYFKIRRANDRVSVQGRLSSTAGGSLANLYTLLTGYRSADYSPKGLAMVTSSGTIYPMAVGTTGAADVLNFSVYSVSSPGGNVAAGATALFEASWSTADAWPAVLA